MTCRRAVTHLDGLLAERPQLADTARAQLTGAIQLIVAQLEGDNRNFTHTMGTRIDPSCLVKAEHAESLKNTPGSPSSHESFALFCDWLRSNNVAPR